jgi:hypothetical protein
VNIHVHVCDTCGCSPCANRTFCHVCREAVRRAARYRPQYDLPPNWHTMPLGSLWHVLNNPRRGPYAPKATCDALLFELCQHGAAQLAKPNCLGRLAQLSPKQTSGLITVLMRLRPKYPAISDELLHELGELICPT